MNRKELLNYIKEVYNTEPEYLWKRNPYSAVLRHSDSRKWYGLVMNVARNSLGLEGDGFIDVLNVKCDPGMIGAIRMQSGILPGYHMNKSSWISILLDGSVPKVMIENLLDMSFTMTSSNHRAKGAKGQRITQWLIPCNPKYYDVDAAFAKENVIQWKQSNKNISVDDTIYLYVGAPVSAIRYKCRVLEVNIPYQYKDKNLEITTVMRIEKLQQYDDNAMNFQLMKEHGVFAVRGPRSMPESLMEEIRHRY